MYNLEKKKRFEFIYMCVCMYVLCMYIYLSILGDPGADSGDEEKSKRAEKYMARRKVKNGEKSPWGQCLTRPVPNGRRRSGF